MRFYGGSLREWAGAPWGVAEAYLHAIPRLRAEEALAAVRVGAVTNGARLEDGEHQAIQKRWMEIIGINPPKPMKPKTPEEARARMAAAGIFFEGPSA